jgi:Ca2+-binding EF-hand superfamily protein
MDELVTKENIKDLFSIFDLNGDGVITPEELKAIF